MFPDDLKGLLFDDQGRPIPHQYSPFHFTTTTTPLHDCTTSWDCSGMSKNLKFPEINLTFDLFDGWEQLITPSVRIYTTEMRDDGMAERRTYWKQSINWNDPNNALGGVTVGIHQELSIECTPEEKEKIIRLAEEKWEKCMFESGCDPQDDYDCRKCLERRITWRTDGSTLRP